MDQPIVWGDPDPVTGPSTPEQQAAQAKLDAILANRDHSYHKGDQKAADEVLELRRAALGAAGRRILFSDGPPPLQKSAAAAPGTSPPPDAVSSEPAPAEAVERPKALVGEETLRELDTTVRDLGVPPAEAGGLLQDIVTLAGSQPTTYEASEAQLKERWGTHYEANLRAAQHFFAQLGTGYQALLEDNHYDNDPAVISRFAKWGASMYRAQQEIDRINADPDHPAHHPGARGHAEARAYVQTLYQRANRRRQ
jgi:hypothetical protein